MLQQRGRVLLACAIFSISCPRSSSSCEISRRSSAGEALVPPAALAARGEGDVLTAVSESVGSTGCARTCRLVKGLVQLLEVGLERLILC